MSENKIPLSKRNGLRFQIKPRTIKYRTDDREGEAVISDISTGGCYAKEATLPLSIDDKVILSLNFIESENNMEFEAIVIRSQDNEFAAKFLDVPDELRMEMVKFFARDARENKL